MSGSPRLDPRDLLIIGGGMITHDLILPSVYHLQRLGPRGPDRRLRPEQRAAAGAEGQRGTEAGVSRAGLRRRCPAWTSRRSGCSRTCIAGSAWPGWRRARP